MAVQNMTEDVFSIRMNHWDRKLFDDLIPLPDGTSYNAYLIKGTEKNVLIDTADPSQEEKFFTDIKKLDIKIDYVVSNHAEQDHSGLIPKVLELYSEAKVVTNSKCKSFLKSFLLIPDEKFIEIKDGETLSLGNKTLEFILTPWVHWPETMSTYLVEDNILFSCDFFGAHRATSHLYVYDEHKVIENAKRYYAEIMMPFRTQIKKNIEKVEKKEIKFIAPSHGPVYNNPKIIIDAYKEWISDKVHKKVLIPYVSMHGSTKKIVEHLVKKFTEYGIEVMPLNLTTTDIGILAMELVDASTVILATPYVLTGVHPSVVFATYLFNALRPKTKFVSIVVSYGWGGIGVEQVKNMIPNVKAVLIEPVLVNGYPKKEDFDKLDKLIETVIDKNKGV